MDGFILRDAANAGARWRVSNHDATSGAVQHEFRIGQVGKTGPVRALEIFAPARSGKNADKTAHRSVRVDDHREFALADQRPADRAGAPDIFGDIAAVNQLHSRRRNPSAPDAQRRQDEWKRVAACRAAHQTDAYIMRVPGQQLDVAVGQALDGARIGGNDFDAHAWRDA